MGFGRKIDDEADARRCLSAAKRVGALSGDRRQVSARLVGQLASAIRVRATCSEVDRVRVEFDDEASLATLRRVVEVLRSC